ncbi:MAG: hypothetical protein WAL26_16535 [Mycobacterium sp.]
MTRTRGEQHDRYLHLRHLFHRLALYDEKQRMVFGANTYRAFAQMLAESTDESEVPLRSHGSLSMNRALIESRTLDGNIQEIIYRPTLHV